MSFSNPSPRVEKDGETSGKKLSSYTCKHCKKMFSTINGLGGHQNAHRYERELANRAILQGHPLYPRYSVTISFLSKQYSQSTIGTSRGVVRNFFGVSQDESNLRELDEGDGTIDLMSRVGMGSGKDDEQSDGKGGNGDDEP
ncbi:uncharacterized protein LOC110901409 [Helianthus annuus]|uniref:uncharacterized protein LOC110901409 n=1 Tax=Helianthus annuus TaxID=4232 RepID=UPI000B8F45AE|nr:uncharacterized protein LOC110901409 [Helianthus annuus]